MALSILDLLQGKVVPWDSHTLGNCTSPLMEGFGLPVVEAVQLPCTPVLWRFLVVDIGGSN